MRWWTTLIAKDADDASLPPLLELMREPVLRSSAIAGKQSCGTRTAVAPATRSNLTALPAIPITY
eukprot:3272956-Rhodomonas_salina.1